MRKMDVPRTVAAAARVALRLSRRALTALPAIVPAALAGALVLVVIGQLLRPNFQSVDILFDLPLPVGLACAAQLLLAWALLARPGVGRRPVRVAAALVLCAFLAVAAADTARYFALWADGAIAPRRLLPLSFFVAAILAVRLAAWRSAARIAHRPMRLRTAAAVLAGAFLLPLAEQAFFGSTDYRHDADVAVVLGAGVLPDGRPSDALRDRVLTAVELYRAGRVRALLMTGGIDPHHGRSEPQVMRRLAVAAGVPPEAIVLDERGDNTRASVANVRAMMTQAGWRDCLVVSHDFHLPRIKRLLDRAGVRCWTVPARERWPLRRGPLFRLRELAAWHYYLLAMPGRQM